MSTRAQTSEPRRPSAKRIRDSVLALAPATRQRAPRLTRRSQGASAAAAAPSPAAPRARAAEARVADAKPRRTKARVAAPVTLTDSQPTLIVEDWELIESKPATALARIEPASVAVYADSRPAPPLRRRRAAWQAIGRMTSRFAYGAAGVATLIILGLAPGSSSKSTRASASVRDVTAAAAWVPTHANPPNRVPSLEIASTTPATPTTESPTAGAAASFAPAQAETVNSSELASASVTGREVAPEVTETPSQVASSPSAPSMAPRTGATRSRAESTTRSKRPSAVPRAPRAPLKTPKKTNKPH